MAVVKTGLRRRFVSAWLALSLAVGCAPKMVVQRPPLTVEQATWLRAETAERKVTVELVPGAPAGKVPLDLRIINVYPQFIHGLTDQGEKIVPMEHVTAVKWRDTWAGIKVGMLSGALLGGVTGAAITSASCDTNRDETGVCQVAPYVVGGVSAFTGFILGAFIGALIGGEGRLEFELNRPKPPPEVSPATDY